mmetsp:Transcript_1756/g.3226  ORF Transcript_1756/g.3226 Transcript_1756/m.3226 type:complete len:207 (+) Transcript_1756:940-1560(+)
MVDPDSHGFALVPQGNNQRLELLLEFLFRTFEFLWRVLCPAWLRFLEHIQSRIDPNLVDMLCHFQRNPHSVVMNICDKRHVLVRLPQLLLNESNSMSMSHGDACQPHHLTTHLMQLPNCLHRSINIQCILINHRLNHHRIPSSNPDISYPHRPRRPSRNRPRHIQQLPHPTLVRHRILSQNRHLLPIHTTHHPHLTKPIPPSPTYV